MHRGLERRVEEGEVEPSKEPSQAVLMPGWINGQIGRDAWPVMDGKGERREGDPRNPEPGMEGRGRVN